MSQCSLSLVFHVLLSGQVRPVQYCGNSWRALHSMLPCPAPAFGLASLPTTTANKSRLNGQGRHVLPLAHGCPSAQGCLVELRSSSEFGPYDYSRSGNPTRSVVGCQSHGWVVYASWMSRTALEKHVAMLEQVVCRVCCCSSWRFGCTRRCQAAAAFAFASGMAAAS